MDGWGSVWLFNTLPHEFNSYVSFTDLAADVPVGEPDNHSVLGGVVLVLVLHDKALAGVEVSFPLCRVNKS